MLHGTTCEEVVNKNQRRGCWKHSEGSTKSKTHPVNYEMNFCGWSLLDNLQRLHVPELLLAAQSNLLTNIQWHQLFRRTVYSNNAHSFDWPSVNFIRREHFDYVGDVPEDKWYNMEHEPAAARQKLSDFLKEERAQGRQFDFADELLKYCYSDVFILASSLVSLEKDFEAETDVCLFEETTTAASAAMKVFQRNHLDIKKPIVLDARPSASKKASVVSQKYMAWFAKTDNVFVESLATSGERKIGNYHVDEFVDSIPKHPRGLVIEFHGCYWHACVCKYTDQSIIGGMTGEEIRKRYAERKSFLEAHHQVKVVWECKMKKQLAKNPTMTKFFEEYEPVRLMEMEKALSGGRTEVFKLHSDDKRGTLKHVDVVSMYPAVMKAKEFPIGPPSSCSLENIQTPINAPRGIQ